jgi:uncharacterized RmlC-like cupin family protein
MSLSEACFQVAAVAGTIFPSSEAEILPQIPILFGGFDRNQKVIRAVLESPAGHRVRERAAPEGRAAFSKSLAELTAGLSPAKKRQVVAIFLAISHNMFFHRTRPILKVRWINTRTMKSKIATQHTRPACRVVRAGESFTGKQALSYVPGISAESAGAQGIHLQLLTIPPLGRAKAHKHDSHETAIYVLSGEEGLWYGDKLEEHLDVRGGDFVYIPPDWDRPAWGRAPRQSSKSDRLLGQLAPGANLD